MTTPTPTAADKKAAHQLLSELRTRITTQPLPYQYGVETRALESLVAIFELARQAMKDNDGCSVFAQSATNVLNQVLRPVTTKWHRGLAEGRLASKDGADEFRTDLEHVRVELRTFAGQLQQMAYGTPGTPASTPTPDAETPPPISGQELDEILAPLPFGIATNAAITSTLLTRINDAEANDVRARRKALNVPVTANENAVGLALSGGGIRSATFCLGVVQVLAKRGIFRDIDFLSTVSGGGYTGAFLSAQLGAQAKGAAGDLVGNPYGPDPKEIAELRAQAKYLTASKLWQAWSRVTATLAGMLLNWAAPLLFIAGLALVPTIFGACHVPHCFWQPAFLSSGTLVVLALLAYCYFMRCGKKVAMAAGGVLASAVLLLLAIALFYLLDWGHSSLKSLSAHWHYRALSFAAIASAGPAVVRFLPVFKKPAVRVVVLRLLLVVAAVFIPALAVLIFYAAWNFGLECFPGLPGPLPHATCPEGQIPGWYFLVPLGLILAGITALLDVNLTSPHRLYRDALARTFIGPRTLHLSALNPEEHAPYHLINATVNLPNSKMWLLRERRGDFFLFSKYWSGSVSTGYFETSHWRSNGEPLELKTAMAISGAAASSHMGLISLPALTALLTILNVRLGFWLKKPHYEVPGANSPKDDKCRAGAWCLLREMFGFQMSEEWPWLNLSDGGHLENSGVYELLRRRCKFIIAVDGEADGDYGFGGLMTVIRHSQIDFGIGIEPRLEPLRPNSSTRLSARHALLCKIKYPAIGNEPSHTGLLLYLKASLTGNESELIKHYHAAHPEFPHESTLDQFFDQEQFEAYRQLGVHVADGLFTSAILGRKSDPATIPDWFRSLAGNLLEPEPKQS
jgi:hypothetical protein